MKQLEQLRARLRQFNWLTFMALACVAVTSAFIMGMALKLTDTLSSPDWCARAIKAEQLGGSRSASSCIDLLKIQVKSLAIDNHIYALTLAVCLAVLVVVVLAKARIDLQAARDHFAVGIGGDHPAPPPAPITAQGAASGAVSAAVEAGSQPKP